jgi:hypothetical protein
MPGEWPTALRAGEVAVGSSNAWSIAINRELGGNVSRLPNRKYSWTLPTQGTIDSFNWDPFDIPTGASYEGFYHTHGAFDLRYDSEMFSFGRPGTDIEVALRPANSRRPFFLGTPMGRIQFFDPVSSSIRPYGCVLVGTPVVAAPFTGTSRVAVPSC